METKTYDTSEKKERIILVAVATSDSDDTEQSLDELEELGQTAGAETVAKVIQNRERVHSATYIGKGKIEEVRELVRTLHADTVVCDDELSPAQYHNLEEALDVKVIDRTVMILDIFAKRASTSEGKLQVELAQLRYRSSHLVGGRSELSRLGGGIGTRGPGEQKLEMDRRLIKGRITQVKKELEQVKRTRELTRKKRQENTVPIVAIVGYTNAGKSTLLNRLTDAGILAEDKLFATLDPTTRKFTLPGGSQILLTDTVGFIRNLPHQVVRAFKSTLDEAVYADILVIICDASDPEHLTQLEVTENTLGELGAGDKPTLIVFNKCDLGASGVARFGSVRPENICYISAKTGQGIESFTEKLENIILNGKTRETFIIPSSRKNLLISPEIIGTA